jgi:Concanavalin A-like lectin/glucanases superfamily
MRFCHVVTTLTCFLSLLANSAAVRGAQLQAGAAVVDVLPPMLPVLVNGGMMSRSLDIVKTPVNARAIALADGNDRLVIVVVDSCMMGREVLDDAKALAQSKTGLSPDRILISATHTHSAPSSMGALGTDADPSYVPFLRVRLAEVISAALDNLEPARVGFARADASQFTALRRWIRRPDRMDVDPFGNKSVRANMHAAGNPDNVTGESGPEDPDLSLIAFQALDGRPLAVLANFSMHYYGDQNLSADYYGLFCEGLKQHVAPDDDDTNAPFVAIMSHGCSGDIWRRDYTKSADDWNVGQATIEEFTNGLLKIAEDAYTSITYQDVDELAMAEHRMTLDYRVPDQQRLLWAQRIMEEMGDRPLKTREEVYAREQILLHERQQTEIVMQGLRIGDIGIATTPNETYAITGLKIKAASPLPNTIVIELANGGDGYIPPPEQHLLGGYNTWAARSAGLEVMAEPRITETCIGLLETVAHKSRRDTTLKQGSASHAIAALQPSAWWRLNESAGPHALDSSGNQHAASYEPAVTFYLEGPHSDLFCGTGQKNRAAMFAGGRLGARLAGPGDRYSVSMWIWNGMPNNGREVTGWMFSRGHDHGLAADSDHLGIGGTSGHEGQLVFFHGRDPQTAVAGSSVIPRWQWQHVGLVRDDRSVRVYLNGVLEIETEAPSGFSANDGNWFFGGRSDNDSNWEGRLDEIAVFDRVLSAKDIAQLSVK